MGAQIGINKVWKRNDQLWDSNLEEIKDKFMKKERLNIQVQREIK